MIKEIKYNGFTATPSDYECPDGDLDGALNFVKEDGAIKPIMPPVELFALTGINIIKVYIHQNGYKHFLVVYTETNSSVVKIKWCEEGSNPAYQLQPSAPIVTFESGESFVSLVCVGNTFIVTSDKHFRYVIWKDVGGSMAYSLLGTSVPDLKMMFALDGEVFSHYYDDKALSLATNGQETHAEEWVRVTAKEFIFPNVPRGTWTSYQEFPQNVVLEANTEYRVYFGGLGNGAAFLDMVALDENNQNVVLLSGVYPRSVKNAHRIKKTFRCSNLRVRVYNPLAQMTLQTYMEIDRGSTSIVRNNKALQKTQENLDTLVGALNHFTTKYASNKEKFIHPFFVRYGVRLYDGTYAHISTPILMIPNSGCVPLLQLARDARISENQVYIKAYAFLADLQYAFMNNINDGWVDIISGVDIFISAPVYPYDQGVGFDATDTNMLVYKVSDSTTQINEFTDYSYGHLQLSSGADIVNNYYRKNFYSSINRAFGFGDYNTDSQWVGVQVSPYTDGEICDKLSSVQNFYLIHSFDFNEIKSIGRFVTLQIKNGYLDADTLRARTQLDESLLSSRTFLSGNLFEYNNRLHSYGSKFSLPVPVGMDIQNNAHFPVDIYNPVCDVYVFLRTSEGEKVVNGRYYSLLVEYQQYGYGSLPWFFYPDRRAYKAQFFEMNASQQYDKWLELELKEHDYLNGAYYMAPSLYGEDRYIEEGETPPSVTDNTLSDASNIYVSEVDNPFLFVDKYTVQVGCNKIFAMSVAAKALSQGQFGQFPLYAFTDTGVWALEVSNTGSYVARQPITRDVCLSADSIAQLDNAVVFATDRGIMLLSGSESICLTDILLSDMTLDITSLQGLQSVYDGDTITPVAFRQFIAGCRMLYDYTHQRIVVYNPEQDYAYVYSLKSKEWGMMPSDIKDSINSYPECLAIDGNNKVINLSAIAEETEETEGETETETEPLCVKGLIVTRPLKLGAHDVLKTVKAVIQRGKFRRGNIKSVLYGSRDLFNWFPVMSSNNHYMERHSGTPYKYFRIALICNMQKDESLYGCSVQYELKKTNKLR